MPSPRLTSTDRLGIAWILAAEGADGEAVTGFLRALDQGLSKNEADAIELHRGLRARYLSEGGDALDALISLAETGARLLAAERLLGKHAGLLRTVLQANPENDFAARVALMKIARQAEALAPG